MFPPDMTTTNQGQEHHQASFRGGDFFFFPHVVLCTRWKPDSPCYHGTVSSLVPECSCRYRYEKTPNHGKEGEERTKFSSTRPQSQSAPLRLPNSYSSTGQRENLTWTKHRSTLGLFLTSTWWYKGMLWIYTRVWHCFLEGPILQLSATWLIPEGTSRGDGTVPNPCHSIWFILWWHLQIKMSNKFSPEPWDQGHLTDRFYCMPPGITTHYRPKVFFNITGCTESVHSKTMQTHWPGKHWCQQVLQ